MNIQVRPPSPEPECKIVCGWPDYIDNRLLLISPGHFGHTPSVSVVGSAVCSMEHVIHPLHKQSYPYVLHIFHRPLREFLLPISPCSETRPRLQRIRGTHQFLVH